MDKDRHMGEAAVVFSWSQTCVPMFFLTLAGAVRPRRAIMSTSTDTGGILTSKTAMVK